ncbi:MAG: GTP-binding protein, partial [Candidatus Thermoplasmatota archaeon]|nr:GTP-binding protein [Candidatus Thermoplasmatota archaeon]
LLSDILESEGWVCEGRKLTLTVPKDAFSRGEREMVKAVHSAVSKLKYLMKVARIDYEMTVVSEASTKERESVDNVAKLKVGLVGDSKVGKTSLIQRFVLDQFDDKYIKTIGAKVSKREILLPLSGNRRVRVVMMIWDIIGERNAAELYMSSHFMGMQGILAVCDVTRKRSLDNIGDWASSVFEVAGVVPIQILVNKTDLENQFEIERSDVTESSMSLASPAVFTSAKTGENVDGAFSELAQTILFGKDMKEVSIAAH